MKKIISVLVLVVVLINSFFVVSYANDKEVNVVIPDYQVVVDGASIYYQDSVYPFLNFKGITYIPMTYEYSRAFNLATGWLEGTAFMVAYNPCDEPLPIYETTVNNKYETAVVPAGYNVYVNGKKIYNNNAEYPLLNFRGVTYFPATWEYAVENFGWELKFENNSFEINTEIGGGKTFTLAEKRENDAVFQLSYNKEVPMDDGWFKTEFITEYLSVDYKTGGITKIDDYKESEKSMNNTEQKIDVNDGYAYLNGQKLDGIYVKEAANDFVKPENAEKTEYSVTGFTSDVYSPLEVLSVTVYTANYGTESNWGTREKYTFVISNGKIIPLGTFKTIENVYALGDDIYFNTVDYMQTTFSHYMHNRKMWKLSKDGTLTQISYADYNSIKIIGKANGMLYLKCVWAPENPMDWGSYSVSLVNDGYYTFDGEGIKFVSPYIYSDFDVVSDDGDILSVNNRLDKITKCEINPEYY